VLNLHLPALQTLSESTSAIFVVFDGINECPDEYMTGVLNVLNCLQTIPKVIIERTPSVRVLVTSQPTREITIALQTFRRILTLNQQNNKENIE
jgi:hypothetical protein